MKQQEIEIAAKKSWETPLFSNIDFEETEGGASPALSEALLGLLSS
jgi:hypothetical protein